MLAVSAIGVAITFSMGFDSIEAPLSAIPLLWMTSFVCMGYMINIDDIPTWFVIVTYWQVHKYSFAASVLTEFDTFDEDECGNPLICDTDDLNLEFDLGTNLILLTAVAVGWNILALLMSLRLAHKIRS
jgi:hypothetical protein